MSFTSFDQPTNGALTDGGTELVYLSNPRYYGVDPFTFYVQDASGVIGSGICTVLVNPGAGALSVLTDEERALLSNALSDFLALK